MPLCCLNSTFLVSLIFMISTDYILWSSTYNCHNENAHLEYSETVVVIAREEREALPRPRSMMTADQDIIAEEVGVRILTNGVEILDLLTRKGVPYVMTAERSLGRKSGADPQTITTAGNPHAVPGNLLLHVSC
ncbi:hypothetical protein M758_UG220600 [Ceratodon purpureus]|nr:hypothetical protein M758_UG220600 [Ceratodon purpureus]